MMEDGPGSNGDGDFKDALLYVSTVELEPWLHDWVIVEDIKEIDDETLDGFMALIKPSDLQNISSGHELIQYLQMQFQIEIPQDKYQDIENKLNTILTHQTWCNHTKWVLCITLAACGLYAGGPLGQTAAQSLFTKLYLFKYSASPMLPVFNYAVYPTLYAHYGVVGGTAGQIIGPGVGLGVSYVANNVLCYAYQKWQDAKNYLWSAPEETENKKEESIEMDEIKKSAYDNK